MREDVRTRTLTFIRYLSCALRADLYRLSSLPARPDWPGRGPWSIVDFLEDHRAPPYTTALEVRFKAFVSHSPLRGFSDAPPQISPGGEGVWFRIGYALKDSPSGPRHTAWVGLLDEELRVKWLFKELSDPRERLEPLSLPCSLRDFCIELAKETRATPLEILALTAQE